MININLENGELGVVYDNWQQEKLEFNVKFKSICARKSKFLAITSLMIKLILVIN